MPGWHDVTEPYRQSGQLEVVGLIQEQHPDRAALFMQWKDMDWPLWVDSLNLLELPAVPYTLLINESGRIRYVGPSQEEFLSFMAEPVPQKASLDLFEGLERPDLGWLHRQAKSTQQSSAWLAYAQALYLWHWDTKSASCLDAFEQALASDPGNGWIHFRKGVAHRRLFDQQLLADPIELELAMKHWQKALSLDPDQYIWRRRLQQYGPRLDKPYAFYDWVKEARHALKARGEVPLSLIIEPVGSEIAKPNESLKGNAPRVTQIQIETDKIGAVIGPGGKNIKMIIEKTGADLDINDDGIVKIFSTSEEASELAKKYVLATAVGPQAGETWDGEIVKVLDGVGAIVEMFGGNSGLVHISQLAHERVANVTDVVNVGDKVQVKIMGTDFKGRTSLSIKALTENPNPRPKKEEKEEANA